MKLFSRHGLRLLGLSVVVLIALAGTRWWMIQQSFFSKPLQTQTLIQLPPGSSAKNLVHTLQAKGLLDHPQLFLWTLKFNNAASRLKSGTYQIMPNDTLWQLVEKITKSDVYKLPFRIIEGSRLCELEQQMQLSKSYRYAPQMLADLTTEHPSLEGLLFPSTYQQPYGESVVSVLKLAHQTLMEKLHQVWQGRDFDLPYENPYQLLTAASIIEKEASDEQERQIISGIIINRLRLKMPLQMDPTVAYAIPGCKHIILKGSDLKVDSPYNSYMHRGLPPTPIAMVSFSALNAAAHPKRTSYLYFVAKGDGHHVFSVDYVNQQKAIKLFLRKPNE